MSLPITDTWYGAETYADNIIRVYEKYIDAYWSGSIWLVRGAHADLVVDTGTGIVPPAPFIATLTNKPIIAVALCHYYDHAGGLYSFDTRLCHRLEATAITNPVEDLSDSFIIDSQVSALPYQGFNLRAYTRRSAQPTQLLDDGDIIDIGNRELKVIHIPGCTPGSIALWEEKSGYIFGGETLFVDPNNWDFPPEDIALYESSLKKISTLPVTKVFGGHYGCFSQDEMQHLIRNEIGRYAQHPTST